MTPEDLLRQFAEHHDQHLGWLRRRLGSAVAAEDVEDLLQGAYGRALTALRDPAGAPSFDDHRRAEAWLRSIALNIALDMIREQRGRSRGRGDRRPRPASLDADGIPPLPDERVHVEDDVLESLERDARRKVIADALGGLDVRHRQILQLRYGRGLDPHVIMVLEGLNRRQWEGRHTRAVKAFGRALARLHVGPECGRTRRLLRSNPGEILDRAHAPASDHVATCVACGAFARSAQFALAAAPLPSAIAAWRYDAAERLVRPRRAEGGDAGLGHPDTPLAPLLRVAAIKLAAGVTAAAVGMSALVAGDRLDRATAAVDADSGVPRRIAPRPDLSLAVHETPAQALERSAREMARSRARAARTADGQDASSGARPARTAPTDRRVPPDGRRSVSERP